MGKDLALYLGIVQQLRLACSCSNGPCIIDLGNKSTRIFRYSDLQHDVKVNLQIPVLFQFTRNRISTGFCVMVFHNYCQTRTWQGGSTS